MRYSFAAFDLDGTLLNDQKVITPKTKTAIMRLQHLGVRVILASGRHPRGVLPVGQELELAQYGGMLLCFNGGRVVSCATGQTLVHSALPRTLAQQAAGAALRLGLQPVCYTDRTLLTQAPEDPYVQLEARINHLDIQRSGNLCEELPQEPDKLLLVGQAQTVSSALPQLQRRFAGQCDIYCSTPFFIEVMPPDINKATALNGLLAELSYGREALVSFGDGQNDIPMLDFAGFGVAMENAPDDVKAHADLVTGSCNADGIADAIARIWPETLDTDGSGWYAE